LICETLNDHDPHLNYEVLQVGEEENQTFSSGAVVKVSCTHGFGVNLPNDTIKCVQGKWKPKLPQCNACKFRLPSEAAVMRAKIKW
jgi:hypothetical protein